ncbi:angiopoietin-related protein 1-like [Ylistrum balloti]|uniref:angiopoietin-related protein 1-like n=1 Tax=Ylistrum balloti TaxID=509963 RepID=UPI0029058177|nr:angiopoietin-related protein 1-like [Ylistrum balloti]
MFIQRLLLFLVTSKAFIIEEYFMRRNDCEDVVLNSNLVFVEKTVQSLIGCVAVCLVQPDCESLNFLPSGSCMLSNTTLDEACRNGQFYEHGIYMHRHPDKNITICLNDGILQSTNTCLCHGGYIGDYCERIMEDCTEGEPYYQGQFGTFLIHPRLSPNPFKVVCRMAFDKRTYIQIRHYGGNETLFTQNWNAYKNGFGDVSETNRLERNFWLGNEKIYYLTNSKEYSLIIQLVEDRYISFGQYRLDDFLVKNEANLYAMSYENAYPYRTQQMVFGDSMASSKGAKFSTFDKDNDMSEGNCAELHGAGWWFSDCARCNPNGRLWPGGTNKRLNVSDEFFWEDDLSGSSAWGTSLWLVR